MSRTGREVSESVGVDEVTATPTFSGRLRHHQRHLAAQAALVPQDLRQRGQDATPAHVRGSAFFWRSTPKAVSDAAHGKARQRSQQTGPVSAAAVKNLPSGTF